MPDFPDIRPTARRALIVLAAAGTAAPLIVAAVGAARWGPATIAAIAVAALGLALAVPRSRRADGAPAADAATPKSAPLPAMGGAPPYGAMLEQLADPILLTAAGERGDPGARRFVFANAAARELLRITRLEGPLTTAVRAPEVLAAIDLALFDAVPGHALYQAGGAQDRVWRVLAAPLTGMGGARMALVSLRDETEFRQSERTRADFLANASHELRTPLASLTGFIETLRGHAREDPVARDRFLAIMSVQADRMRRLIDDLMSLSRIELAEHIAPSGEVDMALAAIDVLDALAPLAAERCVKFEASLAPAGAAMVVGERDQLLQVIQNLAENALKYTPAGGEVRVEMLIGVDALAAASPVSGGAAHLSLLTPDHASGRRYVAVRVGDQGPGIARQHLPRLTERFYRVAGQKSEHAGTGLGLAIVKHIVNRHRGGLCVESAEGRGSTFTAYVPMAQERVQSAAVAA